MLRLASYRAAIMRGLLGLLYEVLCPCMLLLIVVVGARAAADVCIYTVTLYVLRNCLLCLQGG